MLSGIGGAIYKGGGNFLYAYFREDWSKAVETFVQTSGVWEPVWYKI